MQPGKNIVVPTLTPPHDDDAVVETVMRNGVSGICAVGESRAFCVQQGSNAV
jgi:hypothetical protein